MMKENVPFFSLTGKRTHAFHFLFRLTSVWHEAKKKQKNFLSNGLQSEFKTGY